MNTYNKALRRTVSLNQKAKTAKQTDEITWLMVMFIMSVFTLVDKQIAAKLFICTLRLPTFRGRQAGQPPLYN